MAGNGDMNVGLISIDTPNVPGIRMPDLTNKREITAEDVKALYTARIGIHHPGGGLTAREQLDAERDIDLAISTAEYYYNRKLAGDDDQTTLLTQILEQLRTFNARQEAMDKDIATLKRAMEGLVSTSAGPPS